MDTSLSNKKFSLTEKRQGSELWYILDNAASFMPALTNQTVALVFRIEATLTDIINLDALEKAMLNLAPRFSYFQVELRRGFFWYYLEPLTSKQNVPVADSIHPCLHMHVRKRGVFLYRVRLSHSRIAVEFCHALTDGIGALTYLKSLIVEYYRLRGLETPETAGIFRMGEPLQTEESVDAFNLHFRENLPFPLKDRKAFHVPSLPLLPGQYRITRGNLELDVVKGKAREHGVTLTELLVSVYFASLQEMYYALPGPVRRRMNPILSVEVPVNLRKFFPTGTMRNFSLYVLPSLDTRLGFYSFPEILKRVRSYMQSELNDKNLSMQIARNVSVGRNLLVRILPLILKGVAARLVHKYNGEATITGFISNLGPVELPEPVASHISAFAFVPPPSHRCKTNANVVSWKNHLVITFGSLSSSTELERRFFTRLVEMGLSVSIESNI